MAVKTRLSFVNWCASATIHSLTSPFQAGWPATNAKYPQQPYVPAKGSVFDATYLAFDFGVARLVELVVVVNPNFDTITLLLSPNADFSAATYVTTELVGRNPWTVRPTWACLLPTPTTVRYMYVRSNHGSVMFDGATYYSFGGVWAGALTAMPSDIRWDERPRIVEPHIDVPLIGGGTHRVQTGRPFVEMQARRLALTAIDTPGTGDDLGTWLSLNESAWNVNQIVSEDELILHEVVGP